MRKPIRKLVRLRVDEISTCSAAANPYAVCLLRKSDDAALTEAIAELKRRHPNFTDDEARLMALGLRSMGARKSDTQEGLAKMTDTEWFSAWWSELSAEERQEYRRLQELIDGRVRDEERAQRQTSTPAADVHGFGNQGRLSRVEANNYGSGRQKRDSLRKIADDFGLLPLCKHIEATGSSGFDESEFADAVQDYATKKGIPASKLWAGDSEESRAICKAASICRYDAYARQAQANIVGAQLRAAAS